MSHKTVIWHLYTGRVPREMAQHRHEIAALKNCVLLYVEDDDATAYLFQTALRENGLHLDLYRVTEGEAALDFLHRHGPFDNAPRPDLVVLDLNLPRLSGIDIIKAIRRDPDLRKLTVVIFSSSRQSRDEEEALAAGADGYFTKEPDLNAFFSTVRSICDRLPSGPVLKYA